MTVHVLIPRPVASPSDHTFESWTQTYHTYIESILHHIHKIIVDLPYTDCNIDMTCQEKLMFIELKDLLFKYSSNKSKRYYFLK